MLYLVFYDYKDDVKKVSLARLLKKERKMSLGEAKNAVDKLMEGTSISFAFINKTDLTRVQREAVLLGIKCKELKAITFYINKASIERRQSQRLRHRAKSPSPKQSGLEEMVMY